ncbi:penicillin-binding protein activator [Saccharospirillum mangrovi]|uniref:penicillin-binding protein activator n=1 Tax=Saccharospirillum mangrovi TaxID=2161747 RepID=UPI0013002E26|nr:penicillin-binding protein activator [Saccharospirillum mangrovi]
MPLRPSARLLAWLFVVLLAGCASQGSRPTGVDGSLTELTVPQSVAERLDLTRQLLNEDRTEEAEIALSGLQFDQLTIAEQTDYAELRAELALQRGDGQEALNWLVGNTAYLFDGLPMQRQIDLRLKRAEAYALVGEYLAAARERIFLAPQLDAELAQSNRDNIWSALQRAPEDQMRALIEAESSPDLTGWLELALISRESADDVRQQLLAINSWINSHRNHPAARDLPGDLVLLRELANRQPQNIAVLVPLSGPLEKAGRAIRSGLLAAWYDARANGRDAPAITFFDTALNDDVYNVYKQAVFEGADLVIGPLDKNRVQRLQSQAALTVPVLALNYGDERLPAPENFYQFGLAPEDEAMQVADQAWQEGHRRAMVLAPNTDWGRKVSDAFVQRWERQGGSITSKSLFTQPDQYLYTVKRALNIDDSETRERNLRRFTERELVFEPRRREDVDFIFMVAFPPQARQLKPILNYQYATAIPVMGTSHLYGGTLNRERDEDLDGVQFVEMPWKLHHSALESSIDQAFNEEFSGYETLVALGVDAYHLHPRLVQLQRFPTARLYGETGTLRLDDGRRIHRELTWATMTNGVARASEGPLPSSAPRP